MAAFPSLVLTNAGVTLQNKVQGGATLEFTNIQMGSGQLNGQPIGPMTALISPNATVPIQGGQAIGQNTYQVEGFFTNADLSAGFWWREIGIFANDPDNGEILYAYANAGDAGDYIPTVTDQRIEKYIYFSMALANATTVTVTIPQSDTYVLQSTVGQANGVAGLDENGAVPVAQGGTGATTAQDAVLALGALFAIAAAAAYDPEGSYAVGDYCTHGGKLHKCGTAIPDGEAWNAEHWTETTVAAELAEVHSLLSPLGGATTAQAVLAALGAGVRPNLLINPMFKINQNEGTSYTSAGYTVDGWKITAAVNVTVSDDGVTLDAVGTENFAFTQQLENPLAEDTLFTFSALVTSVNGALVMRIRDSNFGQYGGYVGISQPGLYFLSATIPAGAIPMVQLYPNVQGQSATVNACKLELGNKQTLGFQDENGDWHLLLQPESDFATQLLKCQRYYQLYSSAEERPDKAVDCRPTMRIDPTQGTIQINGQTYYYNSAEL